MAKEIYIYSQIYDFVAEDFISKMEELQGEDVIIRACSPGGSVFAGWGMIAKMQEHTGKLKIKCDGLVASMMLYAILFCDDVEALDVTSFVLHRADMYVNDPNDQAFLDGINAKLKEKLTAKIDSKKLLELKGVTIKDIFNPEGDRIDVNLTAKEAKDIGLIKTVNKITPAIKAELQTLMAKFNIKEPIAIHKPNPDKMTIEEIKAQHPALYAQILAVGIAEGTEKENDRIKACLVYAEIDPEMVKATIESGKSFTSAQLQELQLKAITKNALANLGGDATKVLSTTEAEAVKTEKEKNLLAFQGAVNSHLNLTEKK